MAFAIAITLGLTSGAEAQAKRRASTTAAELPSPPSVAAALRKARVPGDAISIYVARIGAPLPDVTWHATQPMNPASTMKLVTTFAGLQLLGPQYRWQTSLYADQAPVNGIVNGNVYLRGRGDPKLVPEELTKLLKHVQAGGVHTFNGNLVLDRSYFAADVSRAPSLDGEEQRAYNVAPDALLYSFKTLSFVLAPDVAGQGVTIDVTPPLAQLRIDNQMRLRGGACGEWRNRASAHPQLQPDGTLIVSFKGEFPADCGERGWNIAILNHADFMWGGFVALWHQVGGQFGQVPGLREGIVPRHAVLLASHYGQTLASAVQDINKFSNNVMARQLMLTIGAELGHRPATPSKSAQAVRQWLAKQGLDMPELIIDNGSGLSRAERISAANLGRLLLQAAASEVGGQLRESLPVVGFDGTMRRRLTSAGVAGNAYIKTGTLEGVRAIAGYVNAADGQQYVVVSMINHPNASAAQEAHDALLKWVYAGNR
jgi:D-alanyl-D-alanine carboxypeptidase/D-alanyl-D-alanine-endopeptidase (penicillin-binding protein 4)